MAFGKKNNVEEDSSENVPVEEPMKEEVEVPKEEPIKEEKPKSNNSKKKIIGKKRSKKNDRGQWEWENIYE